MFKVEKFIKEEHPPKRFLRIVRSWDKAGTELGGAFSVGVLMGIDTKNATWILDVIRGQWGSTKREEMIRHTAEVDGREVYVILEIEGGSGGKESGENTVRNLAGFKIDTYHPTGDKEARAYPLSSQVGGGTVHLLNREWTREYLEELRFFPNSKYKDQVDASSGAFNWLAKKRIRIGGAW